MVEIDGEYCKELEQRCLAKRLPWQCAEFEQPSRCTGGAVAMHYCIDRFEWPNRRGELPAVMFTWKEAKQACEDAGKRLCSEAEWTLACEGPERLPFPYGFARDAAACPIDKRSPRVDEHRLYASHTREAELARVDQREPSGSRPRCVSASGVFDLTGNVDEWVVSQTSYPHRSALKGGNWGQFRNACRPATRKHDENWRFYQTGFRCCREPEPVPPADR